MEGIPLFWWTPTFEMFNSIPIESLKVQRLPILPQNGAKVTLWAAVNPFWRTMLLSSLCQIEIYCAIQMAFWIFKLAKETERKSHIERTEMHMTCAHLCLSAAIRMEHHEIWMCVYKKRKGSLSHIRNGQNGVNLDNISIFQEVAQMEDFKLKLDNAFKHI